jgi:hypothetical protein
VKLGIGFDTPCVHVEDKAQETISVLAHEVYHFDDRLIVDCVLFLSE